MSSIERSQSMMPIYSEKKSRDKFLAKYLDAKFPSIILSKVQNSAFANCFLSLMERSLKSGSIFNSLSRIFLDSSALFFTCVISSLNHLQAINPMSTGKDSIKKSTNSSFSFPTVTFMRSVFLNFSLSNLPNISFFPSSLIINSLKRNLCAVGFSHGYKVLLIESFTFLDFSIQDVGIDLANESVFGSPSVASNIFFRSNDKCPL